MLDDYIYRNLRAMVRHAVHNLSLAPEVQHATFLDHPGGCEEMLLEMRNEAMSSAKLLHNEGQLSEQTFALVSELDNDAAAVFDVFDSYLGVPCVEWLKSPEWNRVRRTARVVLGALDATETEQADGLSP